MVYTLTIIHKKIDNGSAWRKPKVSMKPLERQFELRKIGLTQQHIANAIGVSPIAVSYVIRGRRVSARIMRAIAEAIGRDVRDVFPEYFGKNMVNQ